MFLYPQISPIDFAVTIASESVTEIFSNLSKSTAATETAPAIAVESFSAVLCFSVVGVKIYTDKLVVTAVPFGQAVATDTEYNYNGSKDGFRIYSLPNGLLYYQVDENYDIMKVMVAYSMMYGANDKDYYYYETVKGEHYQEYNKKHHTGLQSMHDQLYGPNPLGF